MNMKETAKLLTMIQSLYPSQMKSGEDFNFELTTKLWQRLFQDTPFRDCANALMEYACFNKFMPHPSDLKDVVARKQNPEAYRPAEEAWDEVCLAIKKYGYYQSTEAFKTFDDKLKRVVRMIGWSTICHSERLDQVRRNFFDLWKNTNQVEQESLKLPFNEVAKKLSQDNSTKKLEGEPHEMS